MKNMKKIASVVLALVMVLAMMVPAFADGDEDTTPSTGSITITNAAKGETYTLVQLFDMAFAVDEDGKPTGAYTYTALEQDDDGNYVVPAGLEDYFDVDKKQGYVTIKDEATNADGTFKSDVVDKIAEWAKDQTPTAEKKADGNTLVFDNLFYGYYVVISRSKGGDVTTEDGAKISRGAISVDSTNPNATIVDKNESKPGFPEDGGKKVKEKIVEVGGTVEYTVKYMTVNWLQKEEGEDAEQVINYIVTDTLPDFLENVTVTSITIGGEPYVDEDGQPLVEKFDSNNQIKIAWADQGDLNCAEEHEHTNACYKWESKYDNGAILEITYTATVNEKVLGEAEENHKNEVTVTCETTKSKTDDTDDEDVYTATIEINKYDSKNPNTKLEGAKFILAREIHQVVEDDETGDHTGIIPYEYLCYDADNKVNWTPDNGDPAVAVVTTDENGAASFPGLAEGEYWLMEIEAPDGYNLLSGPVKVEVKAEGTVTANISQPVDVPNSTGTLLPSTGGIGTTIFYTVGGILVVAAVILLITRKRMGNEQ